MDEENVVAGNAIEGVTNYVERNSIMTLTANKHIKFLNDEDPSQTIDNSKRKENVFKYYFCL